MYNSPYFNTYSPQANIDRINNQITELENMKKQMNQQSMQHPSINQTFQLAPNNNHTMKYANTIEEVNKEIVYFDTPFFSKDMSVLWLKSVNGDIKTYELNEIIPKDAKDLQIEFLQSQIEELKGMIKNESSNANVSNDDAEQNATNTTTDDKSVGTTTKDGKPTNVQKVSRSKTK